MEFLKIFCLVVVIIIAVLLIVVNVLMFVMTYKVFKTANNFMFDHHYETPLDFPLCIHDSDYEDELKWEEIYIGDDEHKLSAFLYGDKWDKGLIVFPQGFEACHDYYLPFIASLVSHSYKVLAFDNTGNGKSSGDSQIGLYNSAYDLDRVLDYVSNQYPDVKVGIFGHSWGAFAALTQAHFNHFPKAVCAFSGFEKQSDELIDGVVAVNKQVQSIEKYLRPYSGIVSRIVCGKKSTLKASSSVLTNDKTQYRIYHAVDDKLVQFKHSACYHISKKMKDQTNIECIKLNYGGHHFLFADESQKLRNLALEEWLKLYKDYDKNVPLDIVNEFKDKYPLEKLYVINEDIWNEVIEFFNTNI